MKAEKETADQIPKLKYEIEKRDKEKDWLKQKVRDLSKKNEVFNYKGKQLSFGEVEVRSLVIELFSIYWYTESSD